MASEPVATSADVLRALARNPGVRRVLAAAAELEERMPGEWAEKNPELLKAGYEWSGFEWHEIPGGQGRLLSQLVSDGLLRIGYHSNSRTSYRLAVSARVIEEALALEGVDRESEDIPEDIPEDLFEMIEGQDECKEVLHLALTADRPVHVLLVGVPGSAKTLFLLELQRLPRAGYWVGSAVTRAGLLSYVIDESPRWLLLDETDLVRGRDLSALLSLMATGIVGRLQAARRERERRVVSVFGAANSEKLEPALLNRFWVVRFKAYTALEFRRVAAAVLHRREGVDQELADEIAFRVGQKSMDVRRAVDVARLVRGDRRLLDRVVGTL